MEKVCIVCGTTYIKKPIQSRKCWESRKFCSHKCYSVSLSSNESWKKKISEAHIGKPGFWKGKKRPEFSEEWKKNMARIPWSKGKKLPDMSGENHWNWKDGGEGYHGVHKWIQRKMGKPSSCSHCGRTDQKRYEWANVSKEYKREVDDWLRLCKSCHNKYDEVGKKAWIKRRSNICQ